MCIRDRLVREKILTDISGMRDLSDEETCIEITLKRDARPQVVVNQLYKLTAMETSFGVNMLAIHERRPKQLSIIEALDAFIEHRREVVIRRTKFLLEKAEDRAENLEAFLLALGHLDDFIQIIRDSKNRDEARERLKRDDIVFYRIEQLYPFPAKALAKELKPYAKKAKFYWCQEEPKNMGAWFSARDYIQWTLDNIKANNKKISYIGRSPDASPATGYAKRHISQQQEIIKKVFE